MSKQLSYIGPLGSDHDLRLIGVQDDIRGLAAAIRLLMDAFTAGPGADADARIAEINAILESRAALRSPRSGDRPTNPRGAS